ncbi:UDP-N-acetylmuramate--L-alanine ligase [Cardinium endosymbiont of Nabis limbatus]|uniref:UDP-N-acetylmuramate--L-alanine ligase n=1 Tax=Cardinium endosymbiont of Nabis limbatus TaxID=3066217 RepID=UPI003AF36147
MLPYNDYVFIYFIGIGGIGMSALARLCARQGYQVFGYDQSPSALVEQLRAEGISISCTDRLAAIPEAICHHPNQTLVIYTPAIPTDSTILNYFKRTGYKIQSRAEVLGNISKSFTTIAVAGTHGKTTTSAMVAHILYQSNLPMVAFVGGIVQLYDTNLLSNGLLDDIQFMVAEADEFNKSFLHLQPNFSIVTAADADHPETYTTAALMEAGFIEFIQQNQKYLLIQHKAAAQLSVRKYYRQPFLTYGLDQGDIVAGNIALAPDQSVFDYVGVDGTISNLVLPIAGLYNIENALAAITIGLTLGIPEAQIRTAIASFPGIKRRFSFVCNHKQYLLIDDYAHHPVEISALLGSVKKLYPNSSLTAVFQPHLFSRTQAFYKAFAASLSLADQVFILPIYPAREAPMPGVTAQLILDAVSCKRKALVTMDGLLNALATCDTRQAHQVFLTIGAGDIGEGVAAIAAALQKGFGD